MPNALQPNALQHAGLPCPSLSPRVCSNSCPLSHPAVSSSVASFSSCPQSLPLFPLALSLSMFLSWITWNPKFIHSIADQVWCVNKEQATPWGTGDLPHGAHCWEGEEQPGFQPLHFSLICVQLCRASFPGYIFQSQVSPVKKCLKYIQHCSSLDWEYNLDFMNGCMKSSVENIFNDKK